MPDTSAPVTTDAPATAAAPPPVADDAILTSVDAPAVVGMGSAATRRNVHTTSFEDETIKNYDFDLYKGRMNVIDRIGILVPNEITYGRVHFVDKVGYFICHSEWKLVGGQDVCAKIAPCCERLEAPDKRFACLIIQYNTNPQGALVQPFSYSLKLWRFSGAKYVELREANKEFPLADHDMKLHCTEEQYQRITMQACKDKVVNQDAFKKRYGAEVAEWVKAASNKLAGQVAKSFTPQELLEKLGMAQAPAVVQQAGAIEDIKDLLAD